MQENRYGILNRFYIKNESGLKLIKETIINKMHYTIYRKMM